MFLLLVSRVVFCIVPIYNGHHIDTGVVSKSSMVNLTGNKCGLLNILALELFFRLKLVNWNSTEEYVSKCNVQTNVQML